MITKNHPSAYAELFEKAAKILKEKANNQLYNESFVIRDINDYFACLKDLAEIEKNNKEIDPIFTILPTTEETFDIDANTRDITIPANFAKYGVGVQGDEVAEIIYFSIDRYFDAVDLAEKDILIQWHHEKNKSNEEDNLSAIYKKSLTLQPGKIVFGWPITGEMTKQSGNILFSVRFYDRQNDEQGKPILVYSFGTLTKSIKIQPALNFALDDQNLISIINKNDKIFNNLSNSKKYDLEYKVAIPQIIGYYIISGDENNQSLNAVSKRIQNLPVTFAVKAEIPSNIDPNEEFVSGSPLTYTWKRADYKDYKLAEVDSSSGKTKIQYFKIDVNTEEYNPNEIYYVRDEEAEDGFKAYFKSGDNTPFDDGEELYARYSIYTPNQAGYYWAVAAHNYASGAIEIDTSDVWEVPFAKKPILTMNHADVLIVENGPQIETQIKSEDQGDLVAQWYYSIYENMIDAQPIDEAIMVGSGEISYNYSPNQEGYYQLRYTNTKNNSVSENESVIVPVIHNASEVKIEKYYVGDIEVETLPPQGSTIFTNPGDILSVTHNELLYSDIITYEWYQDGVEQDTLILSTTNTNQFTPTESGWYYCKVINQYKGTSKFVESIPFSVTFRS